MRFIDPHNAVSYITPPHYKDGEHWHSADEWGKLVRALKIREDKERAKQTPFAEPIDIAMRKQTRKLYVIDGSKGTGNNTENN